MISVEGVSKLYRLGVGHRKNDTLAGTVVQALRRPLENLRHLRDLDTYRRRSHGKGDDLLWALRDVSFRVEQGEVLGIIGRNGAGKSTLLKVLSRITEPTEGRIRLQGRISSLLEVGTGFHPELSGRENVYLNGTILGMSKREIDRKFAEIVEFSGVERFLDTPVKRYSSGMKVRLAFSVAAHLEPEILLVDEVLSVGDVGFQRKCLDKIHDVTSHSGRTVIFVSHNLSSVQALCTRVIWMDEGRVAFDGDCAGGVNAYVRHFTPDDEVMYSFLTDRKDRIGRGGVRLTEVWINSRDGTEAGVPMGEGFEVSIAYDCEADHRSLCFGIVIHDNRFNEIFHITSDMSHGPIKGRLGSRRVTCNFEELRLIPGRYPVGLYVRRSDEVGWENVLDSVPRALMLEVLPRDVYGTGKFPREGYGFLPCRWTEEAPTPGPEPTTYAKLP